VCEVFSADVAPSSALENSLTFPLNWACFEVAITFIISHLQSEMSLYSIVIISVIKIIFNCS
jgi:hypothetical protein